MPPRYLLIFALFALQLVGCTPPVVAPPEEEPVAVIKVEERPAQVKRGEKQVEARPRPPVVALVSDAIPAYQEVAGALQRRLGERVAVVTLEGPRQARLQQLKAWKSSDYQQFVAIGLGAAQLLREVAGSEDESIFCQVFDYKSHHLVGPRTKGVGALPGSAELFSSWRSMSPTLRMVGVFTGPGLEEEIAVVAAEAERHGIVLQHRVVGSDKEALFEFKQMASELQGLWLLPDNRILSSTTIKEVMTYSVRNGTQVAVFSDTLLRMGALLSVTANAEEIAAKVALRLEEAYRANGVPGPDLLPLREATVEVNKVAAKRYNLEYSGK